MNLIDTLIRPWNFVFAISLNAMSIRGHALVRPIALPHRSLPRWLASFPLAACWFRLARATDGAYTEAQARSGKRAYAEHCAGCHGVKLEGKGSVQALSGSDFIQRCVDNGHGVDDLL